MGKGPSAVRMTRRLPGTSSTISYVYASRRPRKCATKAIREPTAIGGDVFHSTALILTYHSGAFVGSAAYAATRSTGAAISMSVTTSTAMSITPRLRSLPGLTGARLDVRLQAAEELLPALRDHFGRRFLPTVVLEGDQDRATRVLEPPAQRRSDPRRAVVPHAGPPNAVVHFHLVDSEAHVDGLALLHEAEVGLAPDRLRNLSCRVPPTTVARLARQRVVDLTRRSGDPNLVLDCDHVGSPFSSRGSW